MLWLQVLGFGLLWVSVPMLFMMWFRFSVYGSYGVGCFDLVLIEWHPRKKPNKDGAGCVV